jgi:ubiquinol-cytochrome c reductase cytochrome c1 subunit
MHYNPYYPGRQIAMPPPLTDGGVTYADGTMATVDQEARDVVTFLAWAGDRKMEER